LGPGRASAQSLDAVRNVDTALPELAGGQLLNRCSNCRIRNFLSDFRNGDTAMLAEKFFLILETLLRTQSQTHSDGSTRVVRTSPHIPIQFPTQSWK
jgi:hypothetical protein